MDKLQEYYFKNDSDWRDWLHENHDASNGIYLIFYKVDHEIESMRWEEAVKVALCYGWIDSTAKSLGNGKRRQYFCPRKPKSGWSKLNKDYIKELSMNGLMHESGLAKVETAKADGSWTQFDDVENGVIPEKLQKAFDNHPQAYKNFNNFTKSQRKNYLYWLHTAKREDTQQKRINEIVRLCEQNIKSHI